MNIKSAYIAFLLIVICYMLKDVFHVFSAGSAIGLLILVGFIALSYLLVKYQIPKVIKNKREVANLGKSNQEIRDLVENKMPNE